jgi:hypothetical protein
MSFLEKAALIIPTYIVICLVGTAIIIFIERRK